MRSMWLWMTVAPAAMQARASAAISAGSLGTWGLVSLDVWPLMAASMITGCAATGRNVVEAPGGEKATASGIGPDQGFSFVPRPAPDHRYHAFARRLGAG
jgi:hypothetical protein